MPKTNAQKRQQALNAILIVGILGAVVCLVAGIIDLTSGGGMGWILMGMGFMPLLFAMFLRASMKKGTGAARRQ
jgi:hypothetical protein